MAGSPTAVRVNIKWIDAEIFEGDDPSQIVARALEPMHGILVPGGFGTPRERRQDRRGTRLPAPAMCRSSGFASGCRWPASKARARPVSPRLRQTEFGPTETPVVGIITEWMSKEGLQQREAGGDLGGTMRLGAYPAQLSANSHTARIYGGAEIISERHRHRYEVNSAFIDPLEKDGLVFAGMSPDGLLPEIIERPDHPWFVGVQFHPELKSRPFDPHSAVCRFYRGGA